MIQIAMLVVFSILVIVGLIVNAKNHKAELAQKAATRYCIDCNHLVGHGLCNVEQREFKHPITGETYTVGKMVSTLYSRANGRCGKDGKLWELEKYYYSD